MFCMYLYISHHYNNNFIVDRQSLRIRYRKIIPLKNAEREGGRASPRERGRLCWFFRTYTFAQHEHTHQFFESQISRKGTTPVLRGAMDNALDYESRDSRFDSWRRSFIFSFPFPFFPTCWWVRVVSVRVTRSHPTPRMCTSRTSVSRTR